MDKKTKALKTTFFWVMISAIICLIVVNIFGMIKITVISDTSVFGYIFGFFITLISLFIGIAFIGYEGRGTVGNMTINGLFYFFLILLIVSLVLFIRYKQKVENKKEK